MLVSTKGRYALRVLVDMAEHPTDGYLPLKEIASRQEISEKYLESIMKQLVRHGFVSGLRGKGGGYRLARGPEEINVGEVLCVAEASMTPVTCLDPSGTACPRMGECRTLPFWQGLEQVIQEYIHRYSVADLIHGSTPGNDYVI